MGIADFKVSRDPHRVLVSGWLGGGLGLAAYDPVASAAGLLHAPLPDSSLAPVRSRERPALFLDTALPAMLQALIRLGAQESRLVICIAGGGRLWNRNASGAPGRDLMAAAIELLARRKLQSQARHQSTSDDCCCSIETGTGEMRLKRSGLAEVVVLWKNSTGS